MNTVASSWFIVDVWLQPGVLATYSRKFGIRYSVALDLLALVFRAATGFKMPFSLGLGGRLQEGTLPRHVAGTAECCLSCIYRVAVQVFFYGGCIRFYISFLYPLTGVCSTGLAVLMFADSFFLGSS